MNLNKKTILAYYFCGASIANPPRQQADGDLVIGNQQLNRYSIRKTSVSVFFVSSPNGR